MNLRAKEWRLTAVTLATVVTSKAIILAPVLYLVLRIDRPSFLNLIFASSVAFLYALNGFTLSGSIFSFVYATEYLLLYVLFVLLLRNNYDASRESTLLIYVFLLLFFCSLPLYNSLSQGLPGETRFRSIFDHPNQLGYFACALQVLILSTRASLWLIAPTFLMLALPKSMGPLLVSSIILSAHFLRSTDSKLYLVPVSMILVAVIFLVLESRETSLGSFSFLETRDFNIGFGGSGSIAWRLSYWSALINFFAEQSWQVLLFGYGPGTFTKDSYVLWFISHDPHNEYIRILFEYGFAGLSLFLVILYRILKTSLLIGILFILASAFDNFLEMNAVLVPSLFVLAICASTRKRELTIEQGAATGFHQETGYFSSR